MKAFDAGLSDLRILVVDDEPTNVLLLTGILERWGLHARGEHH
ncbi:MAG TPA: hypothetical protein VFH80_22585 [Solirubrobacteraceae bacterium]|nr:hypothetical protein [Solirubrobacteraceae bacterium]